MEILLKGINKKYQDKIVLENFSASFNNRSVNFLMGESGRGKTTLLNIIMGLEKVDSGEIVGVEGLTFSAVFQEDRLCQQFNSITNVRLATGVKNEKIIEALNIVGLGDSLKKPVYQLSGGMKRRVAIVRAIEADSQVLLLDEPLKGLDVETKDKVSLYIKENLKNRLVIFVTHDKSENKLFSGNVFHI